MNVAIIGSGPAGASCACLLARAGLRPLLIDGSHPRDKPCGGLMDEADVNSWGELRAFAGWAHFSGDRLLTTPRGLTVTLTGGLAANRYMIASRRALDVHLAARAGALGARPVRSHVTGIRRNGRGWRVTTRGGEEYGTDLIIGADGARSVVRRATTGPFARGELLAAVGRRFAGGSFGVIHTVALGNGCSGTLLPGVGMTQAVVSGPPGVPLARLLEGFIRRMTGYGERAGEPFGAVCPDPPRPAFFDPPRAGPGWMLLGDAAGFCNRATGEGLRYAFASAHAAAGAVISGRPESYEERWRDTIGAELRKASLRSHFAEPGPFGEVAALALAAVPRLAAYAHALSRNRFRPGVKRLSWL